MKLARVLVSAVVILASVDVECGTRKSAEWTVMVYMNGKNNLEPAAIDNFVQMASIGSTRDVHLVVEMGRPKEHYRSDYGPWSGVRRFYVKKGSKPTADKAVMTLEGDKSDMGKAENVAAFVAWARDQYPSKRSMLIIWNHGQGYRFELADDRAVRLDASRSGVPAPRAANVGRPPGGYRSISFDADTGNFLYNRDLQEALRNTRIDLLGFDACLMSMLETAYAFRKIATVMVGSQELEPGAGWPYEKWLKSLKAKPTASPSELGKFIVEAYGAHYRDTYRTTLSSTDLRKVESLSADLSSFATMLKNALAREAAPLHEARRSCRPYGEEVELETSIDLALLLERYSLRTKDQELAAAARRVRSRVMETVLSNYASKRLQGDYGSNGLAIYFPATSKSFESDRPDNEGYRLGNRNHPVEFVQRNTWSALLHAYWAYY